MMERLKSLFASVLDEAVLRFVSATNEDADFDDETLLSVCHR